MEIKVLTSENYLIVELKGEFDHHNAGEFKDLVEKELKKGIYDCLLLELSGLKFMDSSGVGAVIGRYKSISNTGGKVIACGLTPQVETIFEISGLKKIISIYPSLEEAINNRRERKN